MKILHVCAGLPISNQSGVPNYVRGIAEAQVSLGNDVAVLSSGDEASNTFVFLHLSYRTHIKSFSKGRLVDKKALAWLKELLEKEKYDIVHFHLAMTLDWRIASILTNERYFVSLHDYWFLCPRIFMFRDGKPCGKYEEKKCKKCISYFERFRVFRGMNRVFKTRHFFPYFPQNITQKRFSKYKQFLENALCVLPVSNRVEEIFKESGINANYNVVHIGNITAHSFDNISSKSFDEDGKINLVFLGRLNQTKGANLLLEIAHRITNNSITIHFFGDSSTYKDLIQKNRIIDHGKYQQKDLPKILEHMDAGLVLPIWEDNSPQVVMEMLNNKLPVFATKMGGIPDFVTSENGYLFNPFIKEEVDAFVLFLNTLTIQTIDGMRKKICRTHTPEEHIAALSKIYLQAKGN